MCKKSSKRGKNVNIDSRSAIFFIDFKSKRKNNLLYVKNNRSDFFDHGHLNCGVFPLFEGSVVGEYNSSKKSDHCHQNEHPVFENIR